MKKIIMAFALTTLLLGCEKLKQAVAPAPIADFNYLETTNGTVIFSNKSQNADTYEWDFNTGDNSKEYNPTYNFANNKDYLVTLTAKGAGGQNSKSKTIRITTKPTTGQVVFWTNFNSNNIAIYVGGVYKGLTTKYVVGNTKPNCDLEGFVTVRLTQGSYSFTAKEDKLIGGLTWAGTINVVNGVCSGMQLSK